MNTNGEIPPIERIQGKGLQLDLNVFKKIKAFQAGGQFWEHQSQTVIREYMGEFLPLMQIQEDGTTVLCQMFVNGKEVASESRQAKGIPAALRKKLDESIKKLKDRAEEPDVDSNVKKIIEAFKLPDPVKDPELYRLYGSRLNPKLMVIWGCEKEEGTSIAPEEASRKVAKESVGGGLVRQLPVFLAAGLIIGLFVFWYVGREKEDNKSQLVDANQEQADASVAGGENTPAGGGAVAGGENTPAGGGAVAGSENTPAGGGAVVGGENTPAGDGAVAGGENTPAGDGAVAGGENTPAGDGAVAGGENTPAGGGAVAGGENTPAGDGAVAGSENTPAGVGSVAGGENTPAGDDAVAGGENTPAGDGSAAGGENTPAGDGADTANNNPGVVNMPDSDVQSDEGATHEGSVPSDTLTVVEGPTTEKEIAEKREAIRDAIEQGEPIATDTPARIANKSEKNLAKLIKPAVVTIVVSSEGGDYVGQGSGFMLTDDGILVTNYHVVEKVKSAKAILSDGRILTIESVIASDKQRDLALLRLPTAKYPFLRLAEKGQAEVGDPIAVMGSPEGLRNTYSTGIISAERPGGPNGVDFLQISAPVSHGSSGSPVVNDEAMVVGIVKGGITSKNAQALNLAIDVSELHEMLDSTTGADEKSIVGSREKTASNERSPDSVPDNEAIVQKPDSVDEIIWEPVQVDASPVQPDSRLQLDEIDREVLEDGKVQVRLKVKIKGETAELSQLDEINCSLDGKALTLNGNILVITAEKGVHNLRISWTGQSGKKHAINATINIGVISVE